MTRTLEEEIQFRAEQEAGRKAVAKARAEIERLQAIRLSEQEEALKNMRPILQIWTK